MVGWPTAAGTRLLAGDAAVRRVDVAVSDAPGGADITLTYHLEQLSDRPARNLVIDISRAPLWLASVSGVGVAVSVSRLAPVVTVQRPRAGGWTDARVAMRFSWPFATGARQPSCVVVPDSLARPLVSGPEGEQRWLQPPVHISIAGLRDGDLMLTGLRRNPDPTLESDGDTFLQAALTHRGDRAQRELATDDAVFSPRMASRFSVGARDGIRATLRGYLARIGDLLGVHPRVRLAVLDPGDLRMTAWPAGPLLKRVASLTSRQAAASRDIVHTYMRLASIWFGTAVRCHGRLSTEVELALCGAVTHWALDQEGFDAPVSGRPGTIGTLIQDTVYAALGRPRLQLAGELGLRIHHSLGQSGGLERILRELARESWGTSVGAREILALLGFDDAEVSRWFPRIRS